MITPSNQQINTAWDELSDEKRTAFFGEDANSLFWNICNEYRLSSETGRRLARFVGWQLLGLIKIEDLRDAIKSIQEIPPEINQKLSVDIEKRFIKSLEAAGGVRTMPVIPPQIDTISTNKTISPIPPSPSAGAPKPQVGPTIIGTVQNLAPINAPSHPFLDQFARKSGDTKPIPQTPIAKINLGGSVPAVPPPPKSERVAEPARVIHYGALKTIIAPQPITPQAIQNQGQRAPVSLSSLNRSVATPPQVPPPPVPPRAPVLQPTPAPAPLPGVRGIPPPPPPRK